MLKNGTHDSSEPKWWFDNIRYIFFFVNINNFLFNIQMLFIKLEFLLMDLDHDLILFIEFGFKLFLVFFAKLINEGINILGIFFELLSHDLLIYVKSNDFSRNRFLEFSSCNQFVSWSRRMVFKIIGRSISASNTLNPSWPSFYLSIPTIWGIMCHLIFHVLSESHVFFNIDTTFF